MNEQGDGLVLIKDVECLNGIAQHLVHMFVSNGSQQWGKPGMLLYLNLCNV